MATKALKLTLSSSRDIPFNKLVLSQANVRRVKAGQSIEELAEDIARRSLLQGLSVRPVLDAAGAETGTYEVPAGGRRFRALELLVRQKRLARTAPVPCVVREAGTDILAEDDSLAENVQRAPLHPLDQFRAFAAMRDKGMTEDAIAAAFFVPPAVVRQRLRLTATSERLLDIYAEDGMTLEQLMAFTVSDDHARQEQVWEAVADSWNDEPSRIRRMLTERTVRASDRRARFVGIDAYEQAGGLVLRDLFESDDGGWLQDASLLDRLVAEKLQHAASAIAAEGWQWVEAALDFPYGHNHPLRRLDGAIPDLPADEQGRRDALLDEYARLEQAHEGADELPDDVDARLGEIEAALAAFEARPSVYDPADMARAGAFVSLDADGALSVDRGYVRPEDERPGTAPDPANEPSMGGDESGVAQHSGTGAVITIGGQPATLEDDDDDRLRPLPERLVLELTAHRTLALRDAVANNPHVALTALLHRLVREVVQRAASGGCLEISLRCVFFSAQAAGLKDSASARAIDARQDAWQRDLPQDDQALWDWLDRLDEASRLALLAHCVSFGVNALVEKIDRHGAGLSPHALDRRICDADRLAAAAGLDMAEAGWQPTVETYLGRVTKPRILEAVREAKGEAFVQLIAHLKKDDMAKEAERLLAGTGWLPQLLRLPEAAVGAMAVAAAEADRDDEALPAFLTNSDGDPAAAVATG